MNKLIILLLIIAAFAAGFVTAWYMSPKTSSANFKPCGEYWLNE